MVGAGNRKCRRTALARCKWRSSDIRTALVIWMPSRSTTLPNGWPLLLCKQVDADVPTIEDVIEKVEETPEDQAAVLNAEADFEAHAEESGDVVESDTAEATAEDAAAPDAPSTDVHPDASEQAKLDTPSVVTVVDPEPADMVAPGEEHAQAVGATVAEGTHDEAADEPEATEELEEAEGVAEAQGVPAEKVVTVGHDPTEAPKEMLAPGEAPATEEDAAAAPVTADSAVDNASEELSEGAGEAKAAMNAADEATEGALAIASESESEDVTKMAEEVALTTGEVSKVASEVLQATGEAKEALQSVATVVEEDAVAEITGDAVSSAVTEQEADKVAEVAEKLNDAAVVAEDAADQAQAAAQEAEQLVDRAEAEGDAATAKQAEDAKNYALAAQVCCAGRFWWIGRAGGRALRFPFAHALAPPLPLPPARRPRLRRLRKRQRGRRPRLRWRARRSRQRAERASGEALASCALATAPVGDFVPSIAGPPPCHATC